MLQADVDLGTLELEYKACGLQLQLSSFARFAASAEDELDDPRRGLTERILHPSSNDQLWISRGNNLQMRLLLQFESGLHGLKQDAVVEMLSSYLTNAKVVVGVMHILAKSH